jgi:type VI secretion system protein ImpL
MTIRRLLLILFLYIFLVWIVAYLLNPDDSRRFVEAGLLWTAVGVAVLLLGVIVERIVSWWLARRAERAGKPPAPRPSRKIVHEDDAALASLLKEADERLAQAPGPPGTKPLKALDLPLYLVIGPEGAGKTAVMHHCGMEPALLSGQVQGPGGTVVPTQVANLWLANQSLFVEVSGRVFASEPERFAEFLSVFEPRGTASWLWSGARTPLPRSIILVYDARPFRGTPEASALNRSAQQIRDRLSAISAAFGAECPVYVLFTNLDSVSYFEPFFANFRESEAAQVFGILPPHAAPDGTRDRVWADVESRRLNRLFQSLYLRLSDRRLLALTQATELAKKPAIYEFPREFKKIRTSLVQFLVDVFKPDPLRAAPRLRGVFFTGVQKVERPNGPLTDAPSIYASPHAGVETTRIFAPQRQVAEPASIFSRVSTSGPLAERWMFLTDLFHRVLSQDRPAIRQVAPVGRFERYRKAASIAAAVIGGFLLIAWTVSWIGNLGLASATEAAVLGVQSRQPDLSLGSLQAIEKLRQQVEQLQRNDSWLLHWGLYTGGRLEDIALRAYFDRLRRVSLDAANKTLTDHLKRPEGGGTYDRLKTHVTVSALACKVDPSLISRVLMDTTLEAHPDLTGERRSLLGDQFNFYVAHLDKKYEPLVRLAEDPAAVAKARETLSAASGPEQQLQLLLTAVREQVKPTAVESRVPGYRDVLRGQDEIPGEFTKEGQAVFEDLVSKGDFRVGEPCVMGATAALGTALKSAVAPDQIRALYYRRYADMWRAFLASYEVLPFSTPADAARRLKVLDDGTKSPLLGVVRLVAMNTKLEEASAPSEANIVGKAALDNTRSGRSIQSNSKLQAAKGAMKEIQAHEEPAMNAAEVTRLFQPAWFTTPDRDRLVSDNNKPYIDGLRGLEQRIGDYVDAAAPERAATLGRAREALNQAKASHQNLAERFLDVRSLAVNSSLAKLLEQPIRFSEARIPRNTEAASSGDMNGKLQQFCRAIEPVLNKYPFARSGQDATLEQVAGAFAPNRGLVWQYAQGWTDIVVFKDREWIPSPGLPPGMHVDPRLMDFLNRSQKIGDALYPGGATQPRLQYSLRPLPRQPIGIRLMLDGTELDSSSALRKTFIWPGSATRGAEGTVTSGSLRSGFGSFPNDLWGVFRLFENADDRALQSPMVQWSKSRGLGGAAAQPIDPPVKIEFVEFPGGLDLFNPRFFQELHCPQRAVAAN